LRRSFLLISLAVALVWFALSPAAQAQACPSICDSGFNTALGIGAFNSSSTGTFNTAISQAALLHNTTGTDNTANGYEALLSNTTGSFNTATGFESLVKNTTGNDNTALGYLAGQNLTTGGNNIEIGANVSGPAGEANTIRIGKQGTQKATFIAGIFGVPLTGSTVVVTSSGKVGVATSSARFKEAIKPMDKASEAVLGLQPVTFRYKKELDPDSIPQFGLVAEQVEKVNPDLVVRGEDGKPYSVRYDAVNAMLLNEFLKEHRKVGELEATVAQQQKRIDALATGLQKVSAQLEASKTAPGLAANNP
jgi:hypothetical protein